MGTQLLLLHGPVLPSAPYPAPAHGDPVQTLPKAGLWGPSSCYYFSSRPSPTPAPAQGDPAQTLTKAGLWGPSKDYELNIRITNCPPRNGGFV